MLSDAPDDQHTPSEGKSLPDNDFSEAKNLVNTLFLTWKNYSLYPEGHGAVTKSLEKLKTAFDQYFARHNSLRLTVKKNQLVCDSDILYELSPEAASEDLVAILFRDGIQWLEFLRGLPREELEYFFSVLNRYKMLVEETGGDVVTDLTDGNLEHINFKAVDVFWESLPLLDFSSLDSLEPAETDADYQAVKDDVRYRVDAAGHEITAKSIADPSVSQSLWEISPAEIEEVQEMVREEEKWDNTEDVIDVLLVILRSQTDQYSFSSVLDFALEEAVETIQQGEFDLLLRLFQSLNQLIYRDTAAELSWMRALIERFFQDLSHPETFKLIAEKLASLDEGDTEKLLTLREMLLYFSPTIIHSIGPVLLQTRFAAVQKVILEVMEYMCLKDLQPLEILLDHLDEKMGEMLLPLLSRLRGERSNRIFFKMSKHPSEQVRRLAVRVLLARDPGLTIKLFPLIDDPSAAIRRDMLSAVAKQKSTVLENMLVKYMQERVDSMDKSHIKACYETLGHCGSERIIPFLERTLLTKGWNKYTGFCKPVHREGAAAALLLMHGPQAEKILSKAANSRFQVIRESCSKARKDITAAGEDANG